MLPGREFGDISSQIDAKHTPVISGDFHAPNHDPNRTINNGGGEFKILPDGWRMYDIRSTIDDESMRAIDRIIAGNITGDGSMEFILKYVMPRVAVMPKGLIFKIGTEKSLEIGPAGVALHLESLREDGHVIRRNFDTGNRNPIFPTKGSHYVFEVASIQDDEPILVEDGQEFGAKALTGVRLRTLDQRVLMGELDVLRRTGFLTDELVRQYVKPYFEIRLFPLDGSGEHDEQDMQMW